MVKNIKVKAIEKARKNDGTFIEGTNSFGKQWCVVKVIDGLNEAYSTFDYKLPQDLVQVINKGEQVDCEVEYTYNDKFKKNELKNIRLLKEAPKPLPEKENLTTPILTSIIILNDKVKALELRVKNLETKLDFSK